MTNLHLAGLITVNPNILIDLQYATTDNFTGVKLYNSDRCFILRPVAEKLDLVQKELESNGLGLKIWDGYRPLSVQKKLWEAFSDPKYIADPGVGSNHNRGAAVDLTLVYSNGTELSMPTDFDEFTEKAGRNYSNLSKEQVTNRQILQDIMVKYDFVPEPEEWWHFDYLNATSYPILNIDPSAL